MIERGMNMMMTDIRHYLNEEGQLEDLPGPALNLVLFMGSIVAWMTWLQPSNLERTNLHCERRPGHVRCGADIFAGFEGETIAWHCAMCGDAGAIRGWQNSSWDRSVKN